MDEKVPYIVFEGEMARHERTIKRLVTLLITALVLLFASNISWLWFFNQFDYSTETVSQGTDVGDNSYVGANGVINNGTADSD